MQYSTFYRDKKLISNFSFPAAGVISGVGKGIIASSTGLLLKTTGLAVTSIKIDPYINIDAGTMAPTESVSYDSCSSRLKSNDSPE